ncbi:MAG: Gfo/Idh/MocA family oxidoreductase [Defluviitaleaceae bacterium]|nr:Gfo/Idh/MocA family oxidoreductase [Defluviitaleaceae bacterium]
MKAAIVGMGGIAPIHVESLKTIGIPIVAVCDNKPHIASAFGKQLGCPYFTDYKAMLAAGGFDVLHICLPHYLHAPVAIEALEKGINVICEKPMATTVEDAKNMIAASNKSGARLEIIYQNRYNPGSQAIKKTLDSGELGHVVSGFLHITWHRNEEYYTQSDWRGRWSTEGGGVLINQSIHTFDLMNYFLGNPTAVFGSVANRAHPSIEVEDAAEGMIYYGDVGVSFYATNNHPYNAPVALEIVCENGRVMLSGASASIAYNDGRQKSFPLDEKTVKIYGKDYWGYSHIVQIEAFYKGTKEGVCGNEGLITQKLINGIYDSSKLGHIVAL